MNGTAPPDKTIHLVAGVSSAGKSTYIAQVLSQNLAFERKDIYFAHQIRTGWEDARGPTTLVHYNLLRPVNTAHKTGSTHLESEPVFQLLAQSNLAVRVSLIVSSKTTLEHRIAQRIAIEPDLMGDETEYPAEKIRKQLQSVDQFELVQSFAAAFTKKDPKVQFFLSTETGFQPTNLASLKTLEWW